MSKVPCGGFKLDENFLGMNENDELSLVEGGGEGKAYQHLVTDGTGTARWEDRLAYVSVTETELMPEQTVAFSDSGEGSYVAEAPVSFNLAEGAEYKVTFDGQQYDCVCKLYMHSLPYIGNISAIGGDNTGEPFLFLFNGESYAWISYDTNASHTIAVCGQVSTVHTIPEKFLPLAASNQYGVVKTDDIVSYYFVNENTWDIKRNSKLYSGILDGRIHAYWQGNIISLQMSSDDSKLYLKFANNPTQTYIFTRSNGVFNRNSFTTRGEKELYLQSSTSGSSKQFKITVDDSGAITATEVTS